MIEKYLQISNKRNPKPLEHCLNDFKKSWKELDQIFIIHKNWIKIIGTELSTECKPLKIEQNILTISVNHPQWRQALIYSKHIIKNNLNKQLGINLDEIKIIQSYEEKTLTRINDTKLVWENHPSRIKNSNLVICKICKSPSPKGEISRWGKCTFCWREK